MKKIFLTMILISNYSFSQEINGIYRSNLTLFKSEENPENNFSKNIDNFITIEVYDSPYTRGYVSILNKTSDGESATFKFIIKGDKKYKYENGETFICYEGVISLLDIETKRKCTIAIDVKVESLIIVFEGGATQLWDLKKI
jgi:hypothetical protein